MFAGQPFFMKKLIKILLLLIITQNSFSQENTVFNYNYPLEWTYISSSLKEHSNNYYLAGNIARITADCEFWKFGYHITKIDNTGIRDTTVVFDNCEKSIKIYSGSNHTFNILDSGMITLGSVYDDTDMSKLFIVKTSFDFDTISLVYLFEDTLTKRGTGFLIDHEYNYVICGIVDSTYNEITTTPNNTFTKAFLLKTTPNGTTIWSKSYIFAYDTDDGYWSGFKKILATYDGGFLLLGFMVNNHIDKNIVMKTDSLGNQQWVRFYGNSTYDNPIFSDIIPTRDSCYIVCGAYTYGEIGGGYYPYDAWILKIDNNGNTKWDRKHRDSITSGITSNDYYGYYQGVVEAENGNLFTICRTKSDLVGAYRGSKFRIRQLDYQGNRIGDKFIDSVGDQSGSLNPQSIIITPDGDLAVGGWGDIYYYDEENNWVSDQRIFLVKTDTCFQDTLLNNIISYNPKPITEFKIECYPNPASSEFFVELPQGMDNDVLEIYSTTGSLVLQQNVGDGTNRVGIFGLEPGMYLVKIRGVNLYGKIIVN